MKKKSIRYAIASVFCVALVVVFSHTINLVEVGTFIHALNILGLIFSLAFAMICDSYFAGEEKSNEGKDS